MPTRTANEFYSVEEADLKLKFGSAGTLTDYSSYSVAVSVSEPGRQNAEYPDLSGGVDVVVGRIQSATVSLTVIVTKATDALYYLLRDQYENKTANSVEVEYQAKGATTGDLKFASSGSSQVINCPVPSFDANGTGRVEVQVDILCPTLAQSVIS